MSLSDEYIGTHVSGMIRNCLASQVSPWLQSPNAKLFTPNQQYRCSVPLHHLQGTTTYAPKLARRMRAARRTSGEHIGAPASRMKRSGIGEIKNLYPIDAHSDSIFGVFLRLGSYIILAAKKTNTYNFLHEREYGLQLDIL